ncbi:hypothetical protein CBFG_01090 [Clostridiales bacterium 1_7_47FAA]|nr:hypothetical protein CBFG_01090 [Clostridiales bacterium 1_7_47FAA]
MQPWLVPVISILVTAGPMQLSGMDSGCPILVYAIKGAQS